MSDIFDEPQEVYFSEKFQNLMILTPATFYMFATLEGSSGKKIAVSKEYAIVGYQLTFIGYL